MHRVPALLALVLVLAGCWSGGLTGDVRPEISPTPSARPSLAPAVSQDPSPLVSVEFVGGECPQGACHRLVTLEADGTLREAVPAPRVLGTVPRELLDAVRVEMDQANFALIESRPFTGECPTAFDGQEVIYTFHRPTGDEEIRSCKVAIDEKHPLFRAVAAVMALAAT